VVHRVLLDASDVVDSGQVSPVPTEEFGVVVDISLDDQPLDHHRRPGR
jgi:hypothetical protein